MSVPDEVAPWLIPSAIACADPDRIRLMIGAPTCHRGSMTPPEQVDAGPVVLRRWHADWASDLLAAVRASLPQLQASGAEWAKDDYSLDSAHKYMERVARSWAEESSFSYAITMPGGEVIGATSLMTRMGPGVLEIGYWVHSDFTGRGYATAATVALTEVALSLGGIEKVAIRHDARNRASARVAQRAGYVEVERRPSTLGGASDRTDVEVIWEHPRG
jgi:ribosomal-protein-serine acetyltransferase